MTWETRDLPVLKAIVELADDNQGRAEWSQIAEHTGFEYEVVQKALTALSHENPPFFRYTDTSTMARREIGLVHSITGHARRTVGTWPTPESLAKQFIDGLEAAAEAEPDEEKRGRLKQMASWAGTTGWSIVLGVAGNAVSKGIGL
ncbi:hypothetical protein [Nonomuraea indica]|uniref:hypothetical protein n=1 Tax=Nonomuraea indica TaxID=1581193 RepID=UPI000C7D855D|nr:hypothetical protein [Nonomuraea indica]